MYNSSHFTTYIILLPENIYLNASAHITCNAYITYVSVLHIISLLIYIQCTSRIIPTYYTNMYITFLHIIPLLHLSFTKVCAGSDKFVCIFFTPCKSFKIYRDVWRVMKQFLMFKIIETSMTCTYIFDFNL
jgi:hypothetical protein